MKTLDKVIAKIKRCSFYDS